ncbi:MAG: SGNH/GDSL hydrolase family protein [Nitratireductor sp.]|nr:SGNH/GDSL hydrolase family protein [Nitratireductor sp.]
MTKPHPTGLEALATWLALPVYVWQGLGVRRRTSRMPPPESSSELSFAGRGAPLRLLVLGDSSAAGVGVSHVSQSFAGMLPQFLSERSGRPVIARIAGMNSATSGQIRDHAVPHIEPRDFQYIALNIGTNDAKNFHSARRFKKDFGTLLYALRARFPHAVIIWSGVIDLEACPALPQPLGRILGIRSRIIDRKGKLLCIERGALAPVSKWRAIRENFSEDGFHASEKGYREWADAMAGYILSLESGAKLQAGGQTQQRASFVG